MRRYDRSRELFERAQNVLAGGVSSEFRKVSQPHPLFFERAEGSRLWDVDGNVYLDFALSQGPLLLGHSHPEVLAAVADASARGQLFAGQHQQELALAETLQRLIPCAERLRFCLSGSEAVQAALRTARAATRRPKVLRFLGHYHGWLDSMASGIAGPGAWTEGLPPTALDDSIALPWNNLAAVEALFALEGDQFAAIITEPILCNSGCILPEPGFLEGLRALCDRYGTALIFDEVITGFRVGLSGAQGYLGVTPDLAVFGKALASGYPLAVVCGKERWMEPIATGRAIHAGTMNSGNPCVAAALATVQILERENPYPRLFALGEKLARGLRACCPELVVQGPGPMFWSGFAPAAKITDLVGVQAADKAKLATFVGGMQERGIRLLSRGLWYVSCAHTDDDIAQALTAAWDLRKELP